MLEKQQLRRRALRDARACDRRHCIRAPCGLAAWEVPTAAGARLHRPGDAVTPERRTADQPLGFGSGAGLQSPARVEQWSSVNGWCRTTVDKVDREILALLEEDARQSFADLGQKVGLSKTPCWHRVRDLEREGVIRGYRAEVDPARVGLKVHAFVHVTINSAKHAEFESAAVRHPAILQCFTIAGQADYLMHVLVADISELDHLLRMEISRMPGVEGLETTVCMKTIKHRTSLTQCLR